MPNRLRWPGAAAGITSLLLVTGCGLMPRSAGDTARPAGSRPAGAPATVPAGTVPGTAPPGTNPARAAAAPELVRDAVLRPVFDTTEGPMAAGSAFVVRWDSRRLLLLTAHHLLGEAGGMSRDFRGDEVPGILHGVISTSADDDTVTVAARQRLPLADAVTSSVDVDRDLEAFVVADAGGAHVLDLAERAPGDGERVWLLAERSGSSGARLYPATVGTMTSGLTGSHQLTFKFDAGSGMTDGGLRGTSGAPVLDADGRVVALLTNGGKVRGGIWAVTNSVDAIRPRLEAGLGS